MVENIERKMSVAAFRELVGERYEGFWERTMDTGMVRIGWNR
jgi:hypothetical protein